MSEKIDKHFAMIDAIAIAKAAGQGGNPAPSTVLSQVYEEICIIMRDKNDQETG